MRAFSLGYLSGESLLDLFEGPLSNLACVPFWVALQHDNHTLDELLSEKFLNVGSNAAGNVAH